MNTILSRFKSLVLSTLIFAFASFSSGAKAAGYQDIAYSVARMSTTATFLYLPGIELDAYNSAFNSIVYSDAYVAYALLYLGNANYQADSYGFTGQHYFAYYKYLGVVDAVQRNSTSAFNSYYTPTANYYADYYNDYGATLRRSLLNVSDSYKSAARIGSNVYLLDISGVSNSSIYSGTTVNNSTRTPWTYANVVPSYAASIASASTPTALWELGHHYVCSYMQASFPSLYLSAAYAGWSAASPYNGTAAYCHFLGNLGKYYASSTAMTAFVYGFYYYYVAALYSGSTHSNFEETAYLFKVTYLNAANSTFASYGAYSESYFNSAGITLR